MRRGGEMGYWESLDRERIEQQRKLPWYERDAFFVFLQMLETFGTLFWFVVSTNLVVAYVRSHFQPGHN